jgi:hypothetical protein
VTGAHALLKRIVARFFKNIRDPGALMRAGVFHFGFDLCEPVTPADLCGWQVRSVANAPVIILVLFIILV